MKARPFTFSANLPPTSQKLAATQTSATRPELSSIPPTGFQNPAVLRRLFNSTWQQEGLTGQVPQAAPELFLQRLGMLSVPCFPPKHRVPGKPLSRWFCRPSAAATVQWAKPKAHTSDALQDQGAWVFPLKELHFQEKRKKALFVGRL